MQVHLQVQTERVHRPNHAAHPYKDPLLLSVVLVLCDGSASLTERRRDTHKGSHDP